MVSPSYKGQSFYINQLSVTDNNLITASGAGALLWAKQIIEHLGVFQVDTLEVWYDYFSTGEPKCFFALMQTLPSNNNQEKERRCDQWSHRLSYLIPYLSFQITGGLSCFSYLLLLAIYKKR